MAATLLGHVDSQQRELPDYPGKRSSANTTISVGVAEERSFPCCGLLKFCGITTNVLLQFPGCACGAGGSGPVGKAGDFGLGLPG